VSELEDDEVVRNVLAGERDQFALLVRRYQGLVRSYCGQMLGDPESKFSTWLMKIASNHCIDCSRKSWFGKIISLESVREPESQLKSPGYEKAFEANNLSQKIIQSLPEEQKSVLLLRELEGFSYQEIADLLGITEDAGKARLKRARAKARKFREELEKE